jgi:hypothetical protein
MSAEPSAAAIAKARAFSARRLSSTEFEQALSVPIGAEERAEILSLVAWFRRRYPTPADRLAYVRRAYRRWKRAQR